MKKYKKILDELIKDKELTMVYGSFKPKDFTYELSIEVNEDDGTAKVVDVTKSHIIIGVQRAIQFLGEAKLLKGAQKVLKESGYNNLDVSL